MFAKGPVRHIANGAFYCLLFILGDAAGVVSADQATPFYTRDQNPLVMIYGLPTPVSANIIEPEQTRLHTSLNLSNTINAERPDNESLFVDVETYQLNLIYDYGLNMQWMFRLHLPFIKHSAGFMDSWIDRYHDLLNLPEDIRPFLPTDQIEIRYSNNDNELLSLQHGTSGIGDISLQAAYQASATEDSHLSYWLSLKLPSGDSEKLTGSDSTDLAIWLAADTRLHGDLWGGNLHVDDKGAPCLIDPAVYGGHREVDLAMMQLFGGFGARVFAAYEEIAPLAPGAAERVPLYQLYPLLVHVNLFGGSYVSGVKRALSTVL